MHSKVDTEFQRTAEALDQGDRAGLSRHTGEPRLLDQVRGDTAVDDAEHMVTLMPAGRRMPCRAAN